MKKYFSEAEVYYAVKTGKYRVQGLKSFKMSNPFGIINSMISNIINRFQSKNVKTSSQKTAHLIAIGIR